MALFDGINHRSYNGSEKIKNILIKNPVILDEDVEKLISLLLSFRFANLEIIDFILEYMTEKGFININNMVKLANHYIKNYAHNINNRYMLSTDGKSMRAIKWINNINIDNIELEKNHKITLIKLGHKNIIDVLLEEIKLSKEELKAFFDNTYSILNIVDHIEKFKELMIKTKSILTSSYLYSTFDNIIKSVDINDFIDIFVSCKYEFSTNDFAECICRVKIYTGSYYFKFESIFDEINNKKDLEAFYLDVYKTPSDFTTLQIINKFNKMNIEISFSSIADLLKKTEKHIRYKIVNILNTDHFKSKTKIDENTVIEILKLLLSYDWIDTYIEHYIYKLKTTISPKILELMIVLNSKYIVETIEKYNMTNFENTDMMFKYACLNGNTELIEYLLNQKFIPNKENVMYVILHLISEMHKNEYKYADCFREKIKSFNKSIDNAFYIINMFSNYGMVFDKNIYEIIGLFDYQFKNNGNITNKFSKASQFVDNDSKYKFQEKIHITQLKHNYYTIESSKKNKNSLSIEYNKTYMTDEFSYMCSTETLGKIMTHIDNNNIIPANHHISTALLNSNVNVFEYLYDTYRTSEYRPDLLSINLIFEYNKRFIMLKRFYPEHVNFNYDKNENKNENKNDETNDKPQKLKKK